MHIPFDQDFLQSRDQTRKIRKILLFLAILLSLVLLTPLILLAFPDSEWIEYLKRFDNDTVIYGSVYGAVILWVLVLILTIYKPEKYLILGAILKRIRDDLPFESLNVEKKETSHKRGINEAELTGILKIIKPIIAQFTYKNDSIPEFEAEYSLIATYFNAPSVDYAWRLKDKSMVAFMHYYKKQGKTRALKNLSIFKKEMPKNESHFFITIGGFFDKFRADIEIGDKKFDDDFLIVSLNEKAPEKKIVDAISQLGKNKINSFFDNDKAEYILFSPGYVSFISRIGSILQPSYTSKDYSIMSHGIDLHDDVVQKNLDKFKQFIEKARVNYVIVSDILDKVT